MFPRETLRNDELRGYGESNLPTCEKVCVLEKHCKMMNLKDMANLIYPPFPSKRKRGEVRLTRSNARKVRGREDLGLDMVGGVCTGRTFNEIVSRGILPSGEVVYLVSYIVGTGNFEERWEYSDRGEFPMEIHYFTFV